MFSCARLNFSCHGYLSCVSAGTAVLLLSACWASIAHAGNDVWDANGAIPPNGIWGTNANWVDASTPGNGDTATFNLADSYTVTFNANPLAIQSLTVSNGSVSFVSSGGVRTLNVNSAGGPQDVSITGGATTLTLGTAAGNAVNLNIGDDLSVQNDAILFINFGSDVTADDFSSTGLGGTVSVSGAGSSLVLSSAGVNNFIGRVGTDGFLLIADNSTGNSIAGNLGIADSFSVNRSGGVVISGGSSLSLAGNLTLANQNLAGQGADFTIDEASSSFTQTGATNITVGSATNGTATINVGAFGSGATFSTGTGTMTINATGTVNIGSGTTTGTFNANGDVTINGGTLNRDKFSAFNLADGKTMTIQNGGIANFGPRSYSTANATYNITGAGSEMKTLSSGFSDIATRLSIVNGAQVNVSSGGQVSSFGLSIDDTSTLMIADGGQVSSQGSSFITFSSGAVTVTGAGSTWTNGSQLSIGGTLTIAAGGTVFSGAFFLTSGEIVGSAATVTVTGAGSTWTNGGGLSVGAGSGTGTLIIEDGGIVTSSGSGTIGVNSSSIGTATVRGAGSTWTSSGSLTVGFQGTGTMTIEDGGSVSNAPGTIGSTLDSTGDVTVTGAGSIWANSSTLTVGNSGAATLAIEAGGSVSNTSATIGNNVNSTGAVTVTGAGSIWTNNGDLTVGNLGTGRLTMTDSGEVVVTGSLLANAINSIRLLGGKLTVNQFGAGGFEALDWRSGTLRLTGTSGLTIGAGGLFGASLALDAGKGLEVDNTLTIDSGAELFASGGLSAGPLISNGDLILSSTTVNGPVTNAAGANITAIGEVTFTGLVSGPGGFFGPGTITFAGGMSPGASPAEVSFEGGVTLANTNTLFIEIGGTIRGTEYDALDIAGALALDGTLNVSVVDLGSGVFAPALGNSFDILDWGSLSGKFDTLNLPALSADLMWNASQLHTTGVLSVALAGDFNFDGKVNAADYVLWRRNDGTQAGYDAWRANFGEMTGSGSAEDSPSQAAVPEPASAMLLAAIMAGFAVCRPGRRR